MIYILSYLLEYLTVIIPLLIAVAYLTLMERKVIGSIQRRKGPNVVGFAGLLQPLADGLKLFAKETIIPSHSNRVLFLIAPALTFLLSLISWPVIPITEYQVLANLNFGVLYLFAISSLGVYGIIIAGWSSNSKYAFLGSLRSAAQMISYEVSIGLIIISVLLCTGSLNLIDIVNAQKEIWFMFSLFPAFIMFFISALAETNRPPFDLPEAEAELVSGYNVEYSSMTFALFFLGEYSNIILMCSFIVVLFLGGWLPPTSLFLFKLFPQAFWFAIKVFLFLFAFIWVRASLPRYRYDQLMTLGWKVFLPLSLGWVVFVAGFLLFLESLPEVIVSLSRTLDLKELTFYLMTVQITELQAEVTRLHEDMATICDFVLEMNRKITQNFERQMAEFTLQEQEKYAILQAEFDDLSNALEILQAAYIESQTEYQKTFEALLKLGVNHLSLEDELEELKKAYAFIYERHVRLAENNRKLISLYRRTLDYLQNDTMPLNPNRDLRNKPYGYSYM
jgi:NADH-quinone oxidoreductase subunit H